MNLIPEEALDHIKELIADGYSTRQIAAKVGVDRNTVHRYSQIFRDLYPVCAHAKPLPECSTCMATRRFRVGGTLHMAIGRRREERRVSTEEMLIEACESILK